MKTVRSLHFPLFSPRKPPFWAFLIAIFAFLMHEKATLMRENLPLMDENPGFVHLPPFERGKTEHETNGFQNTKKRHKTAFSMCISALPLHLKQTNCLLRWHETPLLAIETRIFLTSPIFPLSSQPRGNFRRGKGKNFSLRSKK